MATILVGNLFDTKATASRQTSSPFVSFGLHMTRPCCLHVLPLVVTLVLTVVVVINTT
jgi:hypothetical protein